MLAKIIPKWRLFWRLLYSQYLSINRVYTLRPSDLSEVVENRLFKDLLIFFLFKYKKLCQQLIVGFFDSFLLLLIICLFLILLLLLLLFRVKLFLLGSIPWVHFRDCQIHRFSLLLLAFGLLWSFFLFLCLFFVFLFYFCNL